MKWLKELDWFDVALIFLGVYFLSYPFAIGYLGSAWLAHGVYPWTKIKLNNWAMK